jgi:hypothetical protein
MLKELIQQLGWPGFIGISLVFSILGFIILKMLYYAWPMIYWFFFCPWY